MSFPCFVGGMFMGISEGDTSICSPVFSMQLPWILGKSQWNIPAWCPDALSPTESAWHCCCLRPRAGLAGRGDTQEQLSEKGVGGHCKGICVRNSAAIQKGIHQSFLTKQVLLS